MPPDTTQSMFPTSPLLNTADGTENSLGAWEEEGGTLSHPPPTYSAFTKIQCCGARAEEPKLNNLPEPEPKLRIAAPAPFCFLQTGQTG
jgi:hypothetical protein